MLRRNIFLQEQQERLLIGFDFRVTDDAIVGRGPSLQVKI
tara:strand:+ start:8332 stop:8451 length:120 start_codon:yes stop_codon:yes gene_type:complete